MMGSPIDFKTITDVFKNVFENPSWQSFLQIGQEFLVPFFIGGFTFGIVSATIGYFTAYGMIEKYRSRRKKKLNKKLSAVAHRDKEA